MLDSEMHITAIQNRVHSLAIEKGWWRDLNHLTDLIKKGGGDAKDVARITQLINAEKHLHVITEIAESVEADRNNILASDHLTDFTMEEEEHADVIIRELDRGAQRGLRTEEALKAKMDFNEGRAYRHDKSC